MPLYEYVCPSCKKELEVIQKFDDPSPICPCKEGDPVEMKRQLSRQGGFILKGGGWYADGYSKKRK